MKLILGLVFSILVLGGLSIPSTYAALSDSAYKEHVYSLKPSYYDIIKEIEAEIKLSEESLSGLNFESSDAKKKIDEAWNYRWTAWSHHGNANEKLKDVERNLENKHYENSYDKFVEIDNSLELGKNSLNTILFKIKDAKELEKKYQEDNPSCFLFWCNVKNTYGIADSKIQKIESNIDRLKTKIEKLNVEKKLVIKSLQHDLEIVYKNDKIKKLENTRQQEQFAAELKEKQLQAKIKQEQYDAAQKQKSAAQEQKRLDDLRKQQQKEYEAQIEAQKQSTLNILASQNPLLKKIMTGEITFWVEKVPSYAGANVEYEVERILDTFDEWNGVRRVYSESSADIRITWIRDFNPSVGGLYWQSYVQVGLGSSGCYGEWQPFAAHTVRQILWHEIGHAMGYGHSSDSENIMTPTIVYYFDTEYEDDVYLEDGHFSWMSFCNEGEYTFTLKSSSDSSGFEFYVITPETDAKKFINESEGKHWSNCHKDGNWVSYTMTCYVSQGSSLLVYNPYDNGKTINVDVATHYVGGKQIYDMGWDSNALKESSQYLTYLSSLR